MSAPVRLAGLPVALVDLIGSAFAIGRTDDPTPGHDTTRIGAAMVKR